MKESEQSATPPPRLSQRLEFQRRYFAELDAKPATAEPCLQPNDAAKGAAYDSEWPEQH